jgi:hypothetical protein|tara:strand:+ start:1878 stop:2354 length:477 start_codon:yes stop_codon:yes gene_type:complete
MYIIATTRFNAVTWRENKRWRRENGFGGCIYGTQKKVSNNVMVNAPIFVIEMHNDQNRVKGVGFIQNTLLTRRYKIYGDYNYNFYTYKSEYRVDRRNMNFNERKIMRLLDILLFKGAKHLKRGQGILSIPKWISETKHVNLIDQFKTMFESRYRIKII